MDSELDDDLLPEYHFDYKKAKPNRFAKEESTRPIMIQLDADVAAVFRSAEAVNDALRLLLRISRESAEICHL